MVRWMRVNEKLTEPWAIDLVTRCGVNAGARVLDLACGTGAVTRVAAPMLGRNGEIVGVDGSEAMLAIARRCLASDLRVEWRVGDAASLPFPDGSFDAVLCQQGFQFFADHQRALAEIARVLRRRGRLALSIWWLPKRIDDSETTATWSRVTVWQTSYLSLRTRRRSTSTL
ncbi:MAG: class I SAM-dependent methyltransferase [Bryobacteraceae bacterium]